MEGKGGRGWPAARWIDLIKGVPLKDLKGQAELV